MGDVTALNRTLDQELLALLRGASLECLVCGEFVLHLAGGDISCNECGTVLRGEATESGANVEAGLQSPVQAG